MISKQSTSLIFSALAASLLCACAQSDQPPRLYPDDAGIVARGKSVYAEQCAACHGVHLEGQSNWQQRMANGRLPAPPHDDSGHTWHHADAELIDMTRLGLGEYIGDPSYASDMPAFKDVLSDNDIIAALSYIKSTWRPDTREANDRVNAR